MNLTTEMIADIWGELLHRVSSIRAAGGVSVRDVVDGTPIPDGFVLDVATEYYIPANLHLDDQCKKQ